MALARTDLDVTDARRVEVAIARARPGAVVHCAAFTAVDDCESQPDLAFRVNAQGARNVALACREAGGKIIHETPKEKRQQFAAEIWRLRLARGTDRHR